MLKQIVSAAAGAVMATNALADATTYWFDFSPLDVYFGPASFPIGNAGHVRGSFVGDDLNLDGRISQDELQAMFVATENGGATGNSGVFQTYPNFNIPIPPTQPQSGSTQNFLYDANLNTLSFTVQGNRNRFSLRGAAGTSVTYNSAGTDIEFRWNPTSTLVVTVPEPAAAWQMMAGTLALLGALRFSSRGRRSDQQRR